MRSDPSQASDQLTAIFAAGDIHQTAAIGGNCIRRTHHIEDIEQTLAVIAASNQADRNVYFSPNPMKDVGLTGDRNVKRARSCFAEWDVKQLGTDDHARQREIVAARIDAACLPPPSMLIDSGHGLHAYWLLSRAVEDLDLWAVITDALITAVGSDPACSNPERLMRLAGFINWKEPKALARLLYCDAATRYTVDDIGSAVIHGNTAGDTIADPGAVDDAVANHVSERPASARESVIDAFLARVSIRDVLDPHGYTFAGPMFRRPGKEDRGFSGMIRRNRQGHEVSVHFSENDRLNDHKFGATQGRRGWCGIHDSFSAFAILNHNGDERAAVAAAAKMLGLRTKHRRDGDILRAIQASDQADTFARLFFAETGDSLAIRRIAMAEIIRRHTSNPLQVDRLLALATQTKGAA